MSTVSRFCPLSSLAALVLMGCNNQSVQLLKKGEEAVDVTSVVYQKILASAKDRDAWAQGSAKTFGGQKLVPTIKSVCSMLAITQQESSFQADSVVPGLSKIAWKETDRHAERMHIPLSAVHVALKISPPTGRSRSERLDTMKTEKQPSAIFDDLINMVSVGQALSGSFSPVHTGGPMQVNIAFAEQHTSEYPWEIAGTVCQEVFSRRGRLWFGMYHLLNYPVNCSVPIFRSADFNVGWYANRNTVFQSVVSKASGVKLAMDGDLILYGSSEPGKTELAICRLVEKLGMSESEIRQQLQEGDSLAFEKTALYEKAHKLAKAKTGKMLPREMLSGTQLESPKVTCNLTTAWFAKWVDDRQAKCMNQPSLW